MTDKKVIICPQCKNKIEDQEATRCPRCFKILVEHTTCTGCGKCNRGRKL